MYFRLKFEEKTKIIFYMMKTTTTTTKNRIYYMRQKLKESENEKIKIL